MEWGKTSTRQILFGKHISSIFLSMYLDKGIMSIFHLQFIILSLFEKMLQTYKTIKYLEQARLAQSVER